MSTAEFYSPGDRRTKPIMTDKHQKRIEEWLATDSAGFFEHLFTLDWYAAALTDWVAAVPVVSGARVLEVGCGPGTLSRHLAQLGATVHGVDRSAEMIALAQRSAPPGCSFEEGDALALPGPDGQYDVTLAASLINLVPAPSALVAELARVTRSGGAVSVHFPTPALHTHADRIITDLGLAGFSAAVLRMWASRPPKLDHQDVVGLFCERGLGEVQTAWFLDGAVAAVTGRVEAAGRR
ncbi:MAG TPA: class I SAM-dependent methyltransferase [Polyangiaceae bacterium]|nr:class I SAM-dependent methyltransferase [Polyangiaceae bacterium]